MKKATNDADMQKRMFAKYGPKWHWQVKDTEENSGFADHLRYNDEEWERKEEDDFYYTQKEAEEEWESNYLKERDERLTRRAFMTVDEAWQDEWDEKIDQDDALWCSSMDDSRQESLRMDARNREKAEYEKNGWPWPPKEF